MSSGPIKGKILIYLLKELMLQIVNVQHARKEKVSIQQLIYCIQCENCEGIDSYSGYCTKCSAGQVIDSDSQKKKFCFKCILFSGRTEH